MTDALQLGRVTEVKFGSKSDGLGRVVSWLPWDIVVWSGFLAG